MKFGYYLLFGFGAILPSMAGGQCPPPGFPDAGNTCPQAPILCENLHGYCNTINNNNTPQSFPGCPGWQLNNDEWFAFFAGTTSISIQVIPSNCTQGPNMGLQAGIYAGCGPPWQPMALQCACTQNPFTLTSNNYVVGQIYYFVLDGCAGNVCNYAINVLSGSTVGVPPNDPGPITGTSPVCQGTSTAFNIDPVTAATVYTWTLTPSSAGTINGQGSRNITVNWSSNYSGPVELCVQVSNLCYSNPNIQCFEVDVIQRPTAQISGSGIICANNPQPVNLSVSFTGEGPWVFTYAHNGNNQGPITTNDNPYTLSVSEPGTYTLVNVATQVGNCTGTVSGTATVTQINLNAQAVPTDEQCGTGNGAISLNYGGGNAPYSFEWSNGANTQNLNNLSAGEYTVTVTDGNGCTVVRTATVQDQQINITISGSTQPNTTCIGGNGAINIGVSPTGTYTYQWSSGQNTSSINNLEPGTYTVTVTTGVTCSATAEFTIDDQPNTPNLSATAVNTTCDLPNGSINLSASGGVSPYAYAWSNGAQTEDLSNISAGAYAVTVTGANGCTATLELTVENSNPPIFINGNVVSNTTCIGGNGSISTSVSPAGNYTYAWSTGANTPNINNLSPGTYTLTVSAGGTCTETAEFEVPDDPLEPNVNATATASTCELPNGSISLSVSGGQGPYTFLWSTGATTQNLNNIPAGAYAVTVTGANGCSRVENIDVDNTNPPFSINGNVLANTTCIGGNGSISTSVSPPGNYTYTWSTGANTPNINGLTAGTYTVTVSAGGACVESAEFEVPDEPNTPNIFANPTGSICELPNGSINLSVSGGVAPYAYLWSNGATSQNLFNISSGSYTVTVTGANGCSSTEEVFVENENPPIDIFANIQPNTRCVGGNGSISLSVSPPNFPYTFQWSTGANTSGITNLPGGIYDVTVNGGGACIETAPFEVPNEPLEPLLSFSQTNATCGLSNGSISAGASGGTPPYSYQWSSGHTTPNVNNVPSGFYFVTVTGSNGCTATDGVFLENEEIPISLDGDVTDKTSCVANNGSIRLFYSPNNVTFSWSNGATQPVLNNLSAGTYTVTVSAGGTCTETAEFTVVDASETPNIFEEITAATCGFANGSIVLSVFDGIPPYGYQWTTGANTPAVGNLAAGNYAVTVSTSVGCTATGFFTVPAETINIEISGTVSDNVSCTAPNGFIDLDLFPTAPYNYQWSNGRTTQDIYDVPAGTYAVTVTLGIGCSAEASFEVLNNATPPTVSTSTVPATCGQSNGSATANAVGGSSPYGFQWSGGGNTSTVHNRPPGVYTVTVTDFWGCSATATAAIANTTVAVNIDGNATPNTSCTAPNGSVNISAAPNLPYTYAWSNNATTINITDVAPGTYTVTVSAGVGCTASATFVVLNDTADPVIELSVTPAVCGLNNGAVATTVGAGTEPYQFAWSNGANTQNISNIFAAVYTITVTDANGCTAVGTASVPNNASTFSLSGAVTPLSSCAVANGAIDLTVTPPGSYTFEWSNGQTTEDLAGIPAGVYTVSVTEQGDCTASLTFVVPDNQTFPNLNQTVTPEICDLSDGAINLSVAGGVPPYTFLWSNGQTTEDLAGIAAGTYTVTVSGANSCSSTAVVAVPANQISFSVSGTSSANTSCIANNGAIALTLNPPTPPQGPGYSFQWSNQATTQNVNNLSPGLYTVTVSAGGNCTNTAGFNVANNALPPNIAENVGAALCGQSSGFVNLTVSGGASPYGFTWSNGASTKDLAGLTSGVYTVTVSGANGCSAVRTYTVQENTVIPAISATPIPNTSCLSPNGSINLSVLPTQLTYSFLWSNGKTTKDIAGLSAGDYTVTVNGGGACVNTATFSVSNDTPAPVLSADISPALCGQSSGNIDLSATGGAIPYTFRWSNNTALEDLASVPSGIYSVTATGANGCSSTASWVVPENTVVPQIGADITAVSSCVIANGAISVSAAPAGLNYTYLWSNGQTAASIGNLPVGNYTVTVNGGGSCVNTATFVVTSATGTIVFDTLSPLPINCFGEKTGAIRVSASGGSPPYIFKWSPALPGDPQHPVGLGAGTYTVTVTDAAGCTAVGSVTLQQPASALQLSCAATKVVSEPGAQDGTAVLTLGGGTPPYSVSWSPSGSTQGNVPAGVFPIDNLGVGTYQVVVADANGCSTSCSFVIPLLACETKIGSMSPGALSLCGTGCLTATYNPAGEVLEPGDVRQFILHEGSGAQIVGEIARNHTPTFCFDPSRMSYGKTYYISAAAGNSDGNGNVSLGHFCTVVSAGTPVVFRQQPKAGIGAPTPITCATPQVPLSGTSDIAGSTFTWNTADGQIAGNPLSPAISAVRAGTYRLVVEANGCSDTATVNVQDIRNQPKATVVANPSGILNCRIGEVVLTGSVEGTANANTVWLYNGNTYATGTAITIGSPGTYAFVLIDTLTYCSDTARIQIQENLNYPPLFALIPEDLNCRNSTTTLKGSSSVPGVQLTWARLNGADTLIVGSGPNLSVSTPGIYLLIGLEPNSGCTNLISVPVQSDFNYPTANAGPAFKIYCFGQTAQLDGTASVGLLGMTYQWTTTNGALVAGANTAKPTISRPGTYTLVVTNPSNGCSDSDTVVIEPDAPVAYVTPKHPLCTGDRGAIIVDSIIGAQPPIRLSFDGGRTFTQQRLLTNLSPGNYSLVLIDANGCSAAQTVRLNEPQTLQITLEPEVTIRLGETYLIEAEVNLPDSAIAQIRWTPSSGLDCDTCLTTLARTFTTTWYRLTVVSTAGCRDNALLRLQVDRSADIYIPNVFKPDSEGENAVFRIFANPLMVKRVKVFEVFSRWGERVHAFYNFIPDSPAHGWDGRFNGQPLNPGVFTYYAIIELVDGQELLFEGDVTLLR
jgi:hypothetical protein